jgi:Xaa-Pro aminopeptidase
MASKTDNPWLTSSTGSTIARPVRPRVSRAELDRRWQLLREAMEAEGIDLLLAQANSEFFGGNVRYLTDIAATSGIATTVLFPRDSGSIVITHGPDADMSIAAEDDEPWRGVSRLLMTPNYPSIGYSERDEQANVVKALESYAKATIGVLGSQLISASTLDAIRGAYPKTTLVNATDVVDPIRAVKSAEERDLIRATGALQDATMLQIVDEIEPGMKERDVSIRAQEIAMSAGSDQGVYVCGSAPLGEIPAPRAFRDQHRVLAEGDVLNLLLETNGPGGYFTHMVRTVVLGSAPEKLREEVELALEAQRHTLDLLTPGALPSEVWEAHNEFMRSRGRPEETRIYCHSQGYDMMERPVIRAEETIPIEANMNIGCHPSYAHEGVFAWVCDNYLIGEDGAEPVTKLSTEIFER